MNLIIATIKPFKLEDVREALTGLGVKGMMVTEITHKRLLKDFHQIYIQILSLLSDGTEAY
jgi:nitrogen regulatory protein PII